MKVTSLLLAAAVSFTSLSAFAGSTSTLGEMANYPANVIAADNGPGLTRAQVQAELNAQGPLAVGDLNNYPASVQQAAGESNLTRAQVEAELAQARAKGELFSGQVHYPSAS